MRNWKSPAFRTTNPVGQDSSTDKKFRAEHPPSAPPPKPPYARKRTAGAGGLVFARFFPDPRRRCSALP